MVKDESAVFIFPWVKLELDSRRRFLAFRRAQAWEEFAEGEIAWLTPLEDTDLDSGGPANPYPGELQKGMELCVAFLTSLQNLLQFKADSVTMRGFSCL